MAGSLSPKLPWDLANPKWAAILNPVLANPLINGLLISNVFVYPGQNVINHGLGRILQGYIVVMNNADITFYDDQLVNQQPSLTLLLNASGQATISLYVF